MLLGLGVISCLKSDKPGIPNDVIDVLNRSGIFKPGLMTIILEFQAPEDSLKLEAAYYILRNLENNYTIQHTLVDSSDNEVTINPDKFNDLPSIISYRDSIESTIGRLEYRADTIILDFKNISPKFIIDHINETYEKWEINGSDYDFDTYLQLILPYRVANEEIEKYSHHFNNKFKELANLHKDKLNLAKQVNTIINNELSYDSRLNIIPNPKGIKELESSGRGNLLDINIYKIKALRSLGIAATMDYSPFFADSISGHFITKVFLPRGKTLNLSHTGIDTVMSRNSKIAKVYRRSFGIVDNCLFKIKDKKTHTPPFLGNYCYIDVSFEYITTTDTSIKLPVCKDYVYLAVENENELKAIAWGACDSSGYIKFTDIGRGIKYTPVIVDKKLIVPVAEAFVLR